MIFQKKGCQIIALDIRGISSVTDYVLIANGNVERHVVALARDIQKHLAKKGKKYAYIEGMQHGDWIVLDYIEFVIHLFVPSMREKYQLERLWSDGKVIDLKLDPSLE